MKLGVVYKFKPNNKINGTLFYCFEYFNFIKQNVPCKFYIIDISPSDVELVKRIFSEKYNVTPEFEVLGSVIDLYKLNLTKTLILDILTWVAVREFCTNQVYVFSNYEHDMFRYKNDRTVVYFGSYPYQKYDEYCILKINFDIFLKTTNNNSGVFVSSRDQEYIKDRIQEYQTKFNKPIILKKNQDGTGNLFTFVDHIHYVHNLLDTNNRIIPEAFFHNKIITIENAGFDGADSVLTRYEDIKKNGLDNYTLSIDDSMIRAMIL